MSKFLEKAKNYRESGAYNCAQNVALTFAEEAGLSEEMVVNISANFGGGMRMASVCGAFSGGLIALGMFGLTDPSVAKELASKIKEKHHDTLICAELLKINKEEGGDKKAHCDEMIYDCTEVVEGILRANGKIQ